MSNILTKAATTVYRSLPVNVLIRRKIKGLLLAPLTKGRKPFEFSWRGLRVFIDPTQSVDMRLYFDGDYEPKTLAAVERLSPAGATVIDVGANIGLVSLIAAKSVGPSGKVVAVEPSSWSMARLQRHMRMNGLQNVIPVLAASGEQAGEATMSVINGYRVDDVPTNTTEVVKFVTLDDLAAEHYLSTVDLIKTDTDGYELTVLRGAASIIEKHRPAIVFELYPTALAKAGTHYDQLFAFLESHGYKFYDEDFNSVDARAVAASVKPNESTNLIALH